MHPVCEQPKQDERDVGVCLIAFIQGFAHQSRANTEVSSSARPRSPPARVPSQVQAGALRAVSRSPAVGEAPKLSQLWGQHLTNRHVALRGSNAEVPTGKKVSFRKSEERKAPRKRTPWEDKNKSQRGASPRR